MYAAIVILLGLISFFTGYFFLGKVAGQNECADPKPSTIDMNYKGGLAGFIIGIILITFGSIIRAASRK